MRPGGDRPDQPAALLGAQRRVERVLRSGRNGTGPPAGPGPCGRPPGPAPVLTTRSPFASRPARRGPIGDTPSGYGPAAQSEFVLRRHRPSRTKVRTVGASSRPPVSTAASRHGEHEPPRRRAAAAGQRPDHLHHRSHRIGRRRRRHELDTELGGSRRQHRQHPVGDQRDPAQPAPHRRGRHAQPAPRSGDARAPPALASNAAPITVTASARRSSTLAGSSTCVRRQPRHRPRRGRNRPAPRTSRVPAPSPTARAAPRSRPPGSPTPRRTGRSRPPRRQALPSSRVHSYAPRRPFRVRQDMREGRRLPQDVLAGDSPGGPPESSDPSTSTVRPEILPGLPAPTVETAAADAAGPTAGKPLTGETPLIGEGLPAAFAVDLRAGDPTYKPLAGWASGWCNTDPFTAPPSLHRPAGGLTRDHLHRGRRAALPPSTASNPATTPRRSWTSSTRTQSWRWTPKPLVWTRGSAVSGCGWSRSATAPKPGCCWWRPTRRCSPWLSGRSGRPGILWRITSPSTRRSWRSQASPHLRSSTPRPWTL